MQPNDWTLRDPDKIKDGYAFMNAQGTPFFWAVFKTREDAISARESYLLNVRGVSCKK